MLTNTKQLACHKGLRCGRAAGAVHFPASPASGRTRRDNEGRPVNAPESKIHIIGVGSDGFAGLTARGRELLAAADLILGSEQVLDLLPDLHAERRRVGTDLHEVVRTLETNLGRKRLVIVAGGDPLFYGVARYL